MDIQITKEHPHAFGLIFWLKENIWWVLAPCNFPIVAVGSHRGNHFNQALDFILADTVRDGSLLSQRKETHICGFQHLTEHTSR